MRILKILLLILPTILLSQSKKTDRHIIKDICPFECCQFGEWICQDTLDVYFIEGDTCSSSFKLFVNDTIVAKTGNMYFSQIGKVVVIKPIFDFQLNDTLDAYYCNEGDYLISHKNEEQYTEIFWPIFHTDEEDTNENYEEEIRRRFYNGKMIQKPKWDWWVQISSVKGVGWIKLRNKTPYCSWFDKNIDGMDNCN